MSNIESYPIRGTLQLLTSGSLTLAQTEEIIKLWLDLTRRKAHNEGRLEGLRRVEKDWQAIRDMGM